MQELATLDGGDIAKTLTPETVKKFLVRGQGNVTEQEIMLFIGMCKNKNLNPFDSEAYLIKYGSSPAQMITAAKVFDERAESHPEYDGCEHGIVVKAKDGSIVKKRGTVCYEGEQLIGGWAEVFFRNRHHSEYAEVSLAYYNTGKAMWAKMPGIMIDKVAQVTAKRKAFPKEFGGLYIADEMGKESSPQEPVYAEAEVIAEVVPQVNEKPTTLQEATSKPTTAKNKNDGLEPLRKRVRDIVATGVVLTDVLNFIQTVVDKEIDHYTKTEIVKVMKALNTQYGTGESNGEES